MSVLSLKIESAVLVYTTSIEGKRREVGTYAAPLEVCVKTVQQRSSVLPILSIEP